MSKEDGSGPRARFVYNNPSSKVLLRKVRRRPGGRGERGRDSGAPCALPGVFGKRRRDNARLRAGASAVAALARFRSALCNLCAASLPLPLHRRCWRSALE